MGRARLSADLGLVTDCLGHLWASSARVSGPPGHGEGVRSGGEGERCAFIDASSRMGYMSVLVVAGDDDGAHVVSEVSRAAGDTYCSSVVR